LLLAGTTGIRRGELCSLNVDCIDFEKDMIVIPKHAKRSRCITFLTPQVREYLLQYFEMRENRGEKLAPESPLILGPISRRRIDPDQILRICTTLGSKIGIHVEKGRLDQKFTTHCLRHYFTTLMLENGMRREYVDDLRGDLRETTRDIYYHIPIEKLKEEFMRCSPAYNISSKIV